MDNDEWLRFSLCDCNWQYRKIAQPINAKIMDKKYEFDVFISTTESKDLFYFSKVDKY